MKDSGFEASIDSQTNPYWTKGGTYAGFSSSGGRTNNTWCVAMGAGVTGASFTNKNADGYINETNTPGKFTSCGFYTKTSGGSGYRTLQVKLYYASTYIDLERHTIDVSNCSDWTYINCMSLITNPSTQNLTLKRFYVNSPVVTGSTVILIDDFSLVETIPTTPEYHNISFTLILGLTAVGMFFGGGVWFVHNVREREPKQMVNGLIILLVGSALIYGWFLG